MVWRARLVVLAVLVLAMLLSVVAPALATVNPGQHSGWETVTTQFRPRGAANGWIADDFHNPTGAHNGWVLCGSQF